MQGRQVNGLFREARRTLIGLTVAFLIVGLVGIVVFYLLPTFVFTPNSDWAIVEDNSVSVYYKKNNLSESVPANYLSRATRAKEEIVEKLGLKEDNLPDRIRVYLHGNLEELKASIVERKSSTNIDEPLAVIDVISGYEVEPLLVRLLTLFSWGRPSGEFLRLGLQSFFSDRLSRPHLRVAGLGEGRFTFREIVSLEKTNNIPRSLHDRIYDSFDSPNAPAGMSLSGFSSLIRFGAAESPYRYEVEAESASFVSYLINEYGYPAFRELWRANSFREGAVRTFGISLEGLEQDWVEFVDSRSGGGYYDRFYRALTLFTRGELVEATKTLSDFSEGEARADEYLFLKARLSFYRGDWDEARKYISKLESREIGLEVNTDIEDYKKLLTDYESGSRKEVGKLLVFAPKGVEKLSDLVSRCSSLIERAEAQFPELIDELNLLRVFVSGGKESDDVWTRLDHPRGVIFSSAANSLELSISRALVNELSRTPTYSNLLRLGLVRFIMDPAVFNEARELVTREAWESLGGLTVEVDRESSSLVQAGGFVGYILTRFGPDKFTRIWYLTTPLGGDNSLETALNEVVGKGLGEVEADLKNFLEDYPV